MNNTLKIFPLLFFITLAHAGGDCGTNLVPHNIEYPNYQYVQTDLIYFEVRAGAIASQSIASTQSNIYKP